MFWCLPVPSLKPGRKLVVERHTFCCVSSLIFLLDRMGIPSLLTAGTGGRGKGSEHGVRETESRQDPRTIVTTKPRHARQRTPRLHATPLVPHSEPPAPGRTDDDLLHALVVANTLKCLLDLGLQEHNERQEKENRGQESAECATSESLQRVSLPGSPRVECHCTYHLRVGVSQERKR